MYIPVEKTITLTEEIRDTVFNIDNDSAMIIASLECDSLGNVLLSNYDELLGKYNNLKFGLNNGSLKILSKVIMPDIKKEIKDRIINMYETKYVEVEKKFRWWEKEFICIGMFCVAILLIKALKFIFDIKKEIY